MGIRFFFASVSHFFCFLCASIIESFSQPTNSTTNDSDIESGRLFHVAEEITRAAPLPVLADDVMGMDSLVSQSDTRTEPYHDTIQNLHTLPALSASQEVSAIYPVMSRVVDVTIKNTRANHSLKAVVVTQFEMQELSQSVEVEYYDPPKAVHLGPLRSTFKPKSRSVKFVLTPTFLPDIVGNPRSTTSPGICAEGRGGQALEALASSSDYAAAAALVTLALTDLVKDQIGNSISRPCFDFIAAESSSSCTESLSSSVDSSGSCNTAETSLPNTPTLQHANQRRPGTLDEKLGERNPSYVCGEVIGTSTVASSYEHDNVVPGPKCGTPSANDGEENHEQTDRDPIEKWTANTATHDSSPLLLDGRDSSVRTRDLFKIQSSSAGMDRSSPLGIESEPTFALSHNKFWRASMAIILKAFRDVQSEDHDIDFRELFLRESSVLDFSQDSLASILRDIEDSDSGTGTREGTDSPTSNFVDGGFEFSADQYSSNATTSISLCHSALKGNVFRMVRRVRSYCEEEEDEQELWRIVLLDDYWV